MLVPSRLRHGRRRYGYTRQPLVCECGHIVKKQSQTPDIKRNIFSQNTSQTPAPPSKIQTWVNSCGGKRSCIGNDVMKFHGRLTLGMFGAKVPRLSRTAIQISSRRQTGEPCHTRTPLHTTTSPTELLSKVLEIPILHSCCEHETKHKLC